jgi:hypothetical protein
MAGAGPTAGGRTDTSPLNILQCFDRAVGACHQHGRPAIVHLIDHSRRLVRFLRGSRNQRVHVSEARLVVPNHNAGNCGRRSLSLIYLNLQSFVTEISLVPRDIKPRMYTLVFPIQRESNFRGLGRRHAPTRKRKEDRTCNSRTPRYGRHAHTPEGIEKPRPVSRLGGVQVVCR